VVVETATIELELDIPVGEDEEEWINRVWEAREGLTAFCRWMWNWYTEAPHLALLAQELEAIERGESDRLIIEAPVRHGKSKTGSVAFPAWLLLKHPELSVIMASYGAGRGHEFGREARNLILDPKAQQLFPDVRIAADSKAKHKWSTNKGGGLLATGIPGPITGFGAHFFGIDDPFKTIEEAYSQNYRDDVWEWWKADARTRLEPNAAVAVNAARWHDDDLVGRILNDAGAARWRILRLPAIAEKDDPMGRAVGEPLWPERYDLQALELARIDVGERNFAALYQQNPIPEGGSVFTLFERYHDLPPLRKIVIGIDTALSEGRQSDMWAWAAWGIAGEQAYLIEAGNTQAEGPQGIRKVAMFYRQMQLRFPQLPVTPVVRKQVAIDRVAAQHLRERGVPVLTVPMPVGSLEVYANVIASFFEGAKAYIPARGGAWLEKWLMQHLRYGATRHDDYVATSVYALWYAFRYKATQRRREPVYIYGEY